ncbi:uncharacterized protein [Venturia canescens]|uniref:uncharacterized protein n=1 Tax=Venturia canescens TaxID=32260 RepID=UPI001C9CF925|nr:uncharacterized protein LOC122416271 [Venturia canescens]XP_043284981.1 uncharacterized protein LOC122416271 [Venturia canescens]
MARRLKELRLRELSPVEYFDIASDSEEDAVLSDSSQEDSEILLAGDNLGIPSDLVEVKLEIPVSPRPVTPKCKENLNPPEQKGLLSSGGKTSPPVGKNGAENVKNPMDAWNFLFNDEIMTITLWHTNEEIVRRRSMTQYIETNKTYSPLSMTELRALIGLLYFSGSNKDGLKNTQELWANWGPLIYKAVMSRQRFSFIISCLRFDDRLTRTERRSIDKFAPIRDIWSTFLKNCDKYYCSDQNLTIDNHLVSFRGRCPFKTYMRNKRHKHGIKIVMINDFTTYYMINAVPHIGKVVPQNREPVASYYARTLCESIDSTGRNITWNKINEETDTFGKLCSDYSTARRTRHWPLRMFFTMLDYAVLNSFILYQLNPENESLNRLKFIQNLSMSLIKPFVQERMVLQTLRGNLKLIISSIFDIDIPKLVQYDPADCRLEKRKRCVHCNSDRKTQYVCCTCKRPRCDEHRSNQCMECFEHNFSVT